jgi:aspartate oxidase
MKEAGEDIVIVGAGIAGLTTSLGLHRYPPFPSLSLSHAYIYIYISYMKV